MDCGRWKGCCTRWVLLSADVTILIALWGVTLVSLKLIVFLSLAFLKLGLAGLLGVSAIGLGLLYVYSNFASTTSPL